MRRAVDRLEASLGRAGEALERPGPFYAAAALLVLLALLVRLPVAASANDVCCGHPDSWTYFHQAYAEYLDGGIFPDPHRGSGWQLALFATLALLGVSAGSEWTPYLAPMTGDAARAALVAHVLSAALAVGAVAATLLLARELLSRRAALLAAALVALDPFLVRTAASAMSEPLYVPLFVLATMSVLRARRQPAWLLATGALMALAHALRVNGLVMLLALLVFAALLLRPRFSRRRTSAWIAAAVCVFFVAAAPYLAWRASELPHAFDYGTNQRFWADDLWDLDDAWWKAELSGGPRIPRETMSDYFAKHDLADAATRLWQSVSWQVYDLVGSGRWPAFEEEGGAWVGSLREESALTPLLAALALVAAFTTMKRREWWFLPIALAFTFATFVWIYPLVRSVRYFAPLIPLFALAAIAGWHHLAALVDRPHLVGTLLFGAYFTLYGLSPALHVPEGLRLLAESADARAIVIPVTLLWLLVALAPAASDLMRSVRAARVDVRSADEAR